MKKTKGYALALGLCALSAHTVIAQPTYSFREYNPTSKENFDYSVCETEKRFFSCGTTYNAENGTLDISITCRDAAGNIYWNNTYDNMGLHDISGKVAPAPKGIVVVGTSGKDINNGIKNLIIMHIDIYGNLISQASYSYTDEKTNIYGFDVLYEPKDNTFVLGGLLNFHGGDKFHEETDRNGWLMKVGMDLYAHDVQWLNRYSTMPDKFGGWYDCVNNIERLEETPWGIAYYVTGSVSDYKTNYKQDQAVMNLLVDFNGSEIWNVPFRATTQDYPWKYRQYDRGTDALYAPEDKTIYLMYHSRHFKSTMFAEVDINTGGINKNMFTQAFAVEDHVEMNMQWGNPKEKKDIVIGGIYKAFNYMLSMDRGTYTPNWQRIYTEPFDMSDLIGINFDYNTNPLENNGALMQRFFVPHMIVNNPHFSTFYRFACGITNNPGNLFENLEFQTYEDGMLTKEGNCMKTMGEWNKKEIKAYKVEPGKYFETKFKEAKVNVATKEEKRKVEKTCEFIVENNKPSSVENAVYTNGITLYPNPVGNTLSVKAENSTITALYITDMLGRKQTIPHTGIGTNSIRIDVAQLPVGVYTLMVITADGVQSMRFVKE